VSIIVKNPKQNYLLSKNLFLTEVMKSINEEELVDSYERGED